MPILGTQTTHTVSQNAMEVRWTYQLILAACQPQQVNKEDTLSCFALSYNSIQHSALYTSYHFLLLSSQSTAPPLPSRPSFMRSIPEYVVLLPSSHSASSSSQKSPMTPPISTSTTGKDEHNVCLLSNDLKGRLFHPTYCDYFTNPTHQCNTTCATCDQQIKALCQVILMWCLSV